MTKEQKVEHKPKEPIVTIFDTNNKILSLEDDHKDKKKEYLKYKHFIELDHNQIVNVGSTIGKVEDSEYVNFSKNIEEDYVFCYDGFEEKYLIRFKSEEDLTSFKIEHSEYIHQMNN